MGSDNVKTHKDLIVWQKAMDFAVAVYRSSQMFPKSEIFGLSRQIRNSAVSIRSNVAEGHAQLTTVNYIRYLGIAKGSLRETETHIHLARRLNYITQEIFENLLVQSSELGRLLHGLLKALRQTVRGRSNS